MKGSEVQGISALLGEKQGWRSHAAGVLLHYTCAAIQVIAIQFSSLPPAAERAGHPGDDPLRGGDAGQVVRGGAGGMHVKSSKRKRSSGLQRRAEA